MTTKDTFAKFLSLEDLSEYNRNTIRSWRHRFHNDNITEKKMTEILLENNYKIKNKLDWEPKYGL